MIWKPHATVAAIIEKDQKFLMVEEKSDGKIVLNQPSGHLEPDETLSQAVIRETIEETAWQFQPEFVTGVYLWKQPRFDRTYLRVAFCGKAFQHNAQQTLDEGIIRAVWMTHDELIENQNKLRSPMVLKCIDDYLAGHRQALDMLVDL